VRREIRRPSDGQRMSEPDAWDPGSSPKPRADAGVSTPGTSSAHGMDPIGVSDTPEAAGEYDCMIDPLLHRLSRETVSILVSTLLSAASTDEP
jgi:hypothetical protein